MAGYGNMPTSPSSYARWDHIVDSDDDEKSEEAPIAPRPAPARLPPLAIRDDLEDYFRRLDERLSQSETGPADVPRFSADELSDFVRDAEAAEAAAARSGGAGSTECAICLSDFGEGGPPVSRLPCAASHRFRSGCIRSWLRKNTHCPLCRVDLLPIHRASTSCRDRRPPPSPRALGFTRDGGTIARWEPSPPSDVPRPDYVPPHLRDIAGYVEVAYPDQGVARVWRVPQGSNDR